jgi:hypothetical protein
MFPCFIFCLFVCALFLSFACAYSIIGVWSVDKDVNKQRIEPNCHLGTNMVRGYTTNCSSWCQRFIITDTERMFVMVAFIFTGV